MNTFTNPMLAPNLPLLPRRVWYSSSHHLIFLRMHHFYPTIGVQQWRCYFWVQAFKFSLWTPTQQLLCASLAFLIDRIFPPSSWQTVINYWMLWDRSWRTSRTRTILYENRYLPYQSVIYGHHICIQWMMSYFQRCGEKWKILLGKLC